MPDDLTHQDRLQRDSSPKGLKAILESREPSREKEKESAFEVVLEASRRHRAFRVREVRS